MKRIGVVGAGVMGTGVTENLAQCGFEVVLVDLSDEILSRAQEQIRMSVRMGKLLGTGQAGTGQAGLDPGLIRYSTENQQLADVDFVIENITEKWELKKDLYPQLDEICRPEVVFAANTSAISITRIAALTGRADRVLGMHFMNPVPMKPVVEVIRGWHTSPDTLRTAEDLLAGMGKEGIVVADAPGFVSNRVLMLAVNEAVYLVQDQVASAEEVDRIFRSCFGHKMGPLETADLIGLDTILYSVEVLYESFNDSKYRPCPLLKKMVDAGLHGRKCGQGFYTYR